MAQLPSWTQEMAERLIDIQRATERGDPQTVTLIREAQAYLDQVESEINGVFTTVRTGKMPRRLRLVTNEEAPNAAA